MLYWLSIVTAIKYNTNIICYNFSFFFSFPVYKSGIFYFILKKKSDPSVPIQMNLLVLAH